MSNTGLFDTLLMEFLRELTPGSAGVLADWLEDFGPEPRDDNPALECLRRPNVSLYNVSGALRWLSNTSEGAMITWEELQELAPWFQSKWTLAALQEHARVTYQLGVTWHHNRVGLAQREVFELRASQNLTIHQIKRLPEGDAEFTHPGGNVLCRYRLNDSEENRVKLCHYVGVPAPVKVIPNYPEFQEDSEDSHEPEQPTTPQ